MSSKAWRSTSNIKWSMKQSHSAPDLHSPLSRSEIISTNEWINKHIHIISNSVQCVSLVSYVVDRVSGGGMSNKHSALTH